ncbi:membrane protein, partial [Streptomyces sp. NRRL S-444]
MTALLLALLLGVSVFGAFHGIRLYRAETKLPSDLALALEVGATRTTAVGSAVDRLGIRWAPLVLRLSLIHIS